MISVVISLAGQSLRPQTWTNIFISLAIPMSSFVLSSLIYSRSYLFRFLNRHDGTSFIIQDRLWNWHSQKSSWYWNTILVISIACQTRSLTTTTMKICQLLHVQKFTMYGANFWCFYFLDVIQSLVGSIVWLLVLIIWISIFQLNRASWGKIGDQLSFIIPLNRVWHN